MVSLRSVITHWRIGGAALMGLMLIAGAFFFGRSGTSTIPDGAVVVVPNGTREYQETTDTDGDGMRDWEEELRGTDPLIPNKPLTPEETEKLYGTASSSELSNTVTSRFARDFFEKYIRESAGKESIEEAAQKALIDGSIDAVAAEVADVFYTRASIKTSPDNAPSALRSYGNAVASILKSSPGAGENEMFILERALQQSNKEEIQRLDITAAAYQKMIDGILALEAPSDLANEHLNLLNTLLAVHNDVVAMRNVFEDPIPALLRVNRYQDDAAGLAYAFDNIRTAFEKRGITFSKDEPGIFFFSLRP